MARLFSRDYGSGFEFEFRACGRRILGAQGVECMLYSAKTADALCVLCFTF